MFKRILLASILLGCVSLGGGGAQSNSVFLQAMGFVGLLVAFIVGFILLKMFMKSLGCLPSFLIFCAIVLFAMYSFGMLNNGIQGIPDAVQVFLGQKKQTEQPADPMAQIAAQAQNQAPQPQMPVPAVQTNNKAQAPEKVSLEENFTDSEIVAPSLGLEEFDDKNVPAAAEALVAEPVQQPVVEQGPVNLLANLPVVQGVSKVLSADTLYVGGYNVRLFGIDGPELNQTCTDQKGRSYNCGKEAAMWLKDWLASYNVECRVMKQEGKNSLAGVCFLGEYDIAAALVNAGLAFANSKEAAVYEPYEQNAKAERRGLWRGTFYKPSDWRNIQSRKPKIKVIKPKKKKGFLDI